MTEWKTTAHISSSSQISIVALKDVLPCWRLTSSPSLPPLHPLGHPPTRPIPKPIGVVCGCARGCREGGGEESLSICPLLRNSGPPSALMHIVHKSSSLYTLFHSVIYNYVQCTYIGPCLNVHIDPCWSDHCHLLRPH